MEHLGYYACIELDVRRKVFRGHIVGVPEKITFEGRTANELVSEFHGAVQEYLHKCEMQKCKPAVPLDTWCIDIQRGLCGLHERISDLADEIAGIETSMDVLEE